MTDAERAALVAYLVEQRRHYLALAKATANLLSILQKPVYNKVSEQVDEERMSVAGVISHR